MANNEIKFEITQHFGVLTEHENGWRKELNKVSWNGASPKWDIREWNANHDRMSKGVTLTENEAGTLHDILNKFFV